MSRFTGPINNEVAATPSVGEMVAIRQFDLITAPK